MEITLAERHLIKKTHPLYSYCDEICGKSKNLYNYANYLTRQEFINNRKWIRYNELEKQLKQHETYKNLPAQSSQQTLMLLDKNWKSFFKSIKDYSKNKDKYLGRPKLPKYKNKDGKSITIFTNQQCKIKNLMVKFPKTKLTLKTNVGKIQQVRIIPNSNHYVIEVVYKKETTPLNLNTSNVIGIDLGLDNFATITNNIKLQPIVINGKPIKSINQYYNKKKANLMSFIGDKGASNKIKKLTNKRNRKVDDFMHKSSRKVIDYCIKNNIGTIIIGKNKDWKQEINLGKRNNQNFTNIPYESFIKKIQYKAKLLGIDVILTEESYTSKASFLDLDEMKKGNEFSGKRIKRGLYKTKHNVLINADVNGSYNIIRKVFLKDFKMDLKWERIEGVGLHPIKLNIS